jgi:hypothetical protein
LELPKIPRDLESDPVADPVLSWGRFFSADSDEQLHEYAMSDPTIREAEAALERLSDDPRAREEALKRSWELADQEAVIRKKVAQAHKEGLEAALERLCASLGVELGESERARIAESTSDALLSLLDHVAQHRSWPE